MKKYLAGVNMRWTFNIQRAPWWGEFFERMMQMLRSCLRKLIGQAKFSYEELLTGVAEVKAILNSRPLTYLTTDDLDEPVTPSHLISGVHLLSVPEHLCYNVNKFIPDFSRLVISKREISEYYLKTRLNSLV